VIMKQTYGIIVHGHFLIYKGILRPFSLLVILGILSRSNRTREAKQTNKTMKKYIVWAKQTTDYYIEVEAENEQAAEKLAQGCEMKEFTINGDQVFKIDWAAEIED